MSRWLTRMAAGSLAPMWLVAHPMGAGACVGSGAIAAPPDTASFTLFGWLSPPPESTTDARIAQMSDFGFNLALPAWLDQGRREDNLARLQFAEAHGMRCLIWDERMTGAYHWLPSFEDTLDQIVADYRDRPGFWGYYLGDEPPSTEWPLMHRLREALRQRDPTHPAWNNLSGRVVYPSRQAYHDSLTAYADLVHPAVLSADHYDFTVSGDRGQFVENAATLRAVADAHGIPFWDIVQLIPHATYRPLSLGEVSWQVSQLLAYGARGIGYFTYWPPDPDSTMNWGTTIIGSDGRPSSWYQPLLQFNHGVRHAGNLLAQSRWRRTTHSGSVPIGGAPFTPDDWISSVTGRAAIGEFVGPAGERYVLVANSDSLAGHEIEFDWRGLSGQYVSSGQPVGFYSIVAQVSETHERLSLYPGDFVLLALVPPREVTPSAVATPNPAGGFVSFETVVTTRGARFEILDASGRRVWSQAASLGPATFRWHGEREQGGIASPGIYFARISNAGVPAQRFAWLGPR